MPKLRIEYDNAQRSATLSAEGDGSFWANIVRACADHSDQIISHGAASLSMPWWQFLSAREAIAYYINRANADVELDSSAEALLRRIEEKTRALDEFAYEPTPESQLQARL